MERKEGMGFYLVRHGEAKSEEEDPAKPLSEQGRRDVEVVAKKASDYGVKVSEIYHSGKLRAQQTAEILAERLFPSKGLREMKSLLPLDDPREARKELEVSQESLMLVGHLPHLSRLTSLLLVGNPEREIVQFRTGAIVCLSRTEKDWLLKWILPPKLTG